MRILLVRIHLVQMPKTTGVVGECFEGDSSKMTLVDVALQRGGTSLECIVSHGGLGFDPSFLLNETGKVDTLGSEYHCQRRIYERAPASLHSLSSRM